MATLLRWYTANLPLTLYLHLDRPCCGPHRRSLYPGWKKEDYTRLPHLPKPPLSQQNVEDGTVGGAEED